MRKKLTRLLPLLLALFATVHAQAANEVTIPTTEGSYINWGDADLTKCNQENGGASVGSTHAGTVIVFNIKNTVAQDYMLSFLTGAKNLTAELGVTLADDAKTYLDATAQVANTGSWTPSTQQAFVVKALPVGNYTLTIKVNSTTSGYAGNYGNLAFTPLTAVDQAPGEIDITKGSYNGPRVENNTNVGYVTNNGTASYTYYNNTAGSYKLVMDIARYNAGNLNVTIADMATGKVEVNQDFAITNDMPSGYTATEIPLSGSVSEGLKVMTLTFTNGGGFIVNYKNVKLEYAGTLAEITSVAIEGQQVTKGESSDWFCQLPIVSEATTTFTVQAYNGTPALTAADEDGNSVAVTDNADGSYTIPTPAAGKTTTVTLTISPVEGASAAKESYTFKIYHIPNVSITAISVGGSDEPSLLQALNADGHSATLTGRVYTTLPQVEATLVDGSTVKATGTLSGSSASFAFKGTIGTVSEDYTLTVDGINIYTPTEADNTVDLKYSSAGVTGGSTWSDGLYTLATTRLDGWDGSSFKLNGSDYTLSVPADVKVKQLIFKDFKSNYKPADGAGVTTVTSEGATIYLPTKRDYKETEDSKYDLVVNLEGHQAGTPITFSLTGGGQPTAWLRLTTENVAVTTAPVLSASDVTVNNNHAVVALTFDREMKPTTATAGTQQVTAEGGSTVLYFSLWNLDWNSTCTLTIAAGAAADSYGNTNTEPITVDVKVGAKPAVDKVAYDYVVATADEFKTALAAVNSSNKDAQAERKVIFMRNGDYDFGAEEQKLQAYNVSIIGESRDGVLIHGTRDGITNPVLNISDRAGVYLQDVTVRNDKNYGMEDKGGVAVALSGGKKAVLKRVRLLSNQDTQVTGDRAYFEDCEIHGTVDFICGGGDNFYYNTALVLEDRNGNCVTAPATSTLTKWGYVFQHCTIKKMDGATKVTDGSYNLGRPWQQEPRAYYLNTTMEVKPSDNGWAGMSNLPTHFYEFNSMDADGNAIDLSKRGNSSSSTNQYTPVLSAAEAEAFTVENVLGGTDSWLPTELTVTSPATTATAQGMTIGWQPVDEARTYVVFRDGEYVANVTTTSYTADEPGTYTIRTANLAGGLGETSNEVVATNEVTLDEAQTTAPVATASAVDVVLARPFVKGWNSVVLPFSFTAAELGADKAVAFAGTQGNTINFSTAEGSLKANTPYMVHFGEAVDTVKMTGKTITPEDQPTAEDPAGQFNFVGTYTSANATASQVKAGDYIVVAGGIAKAGGNNAIGAFHAFFSAQTDEAKAKDMTIAIDGQVATGIGSIGLEQSQPAAPQYNLAGQPVGAGFKGIVVSKGRKVLRK